MRHRPDPDLAVTCLTKIDRRRNMARFYVVSVEPTLFGGFAVRTRFGRLGARGRARDRFAASWGDAEVLRMQRVAAKLRRGYRMAADL